MAFWNKEADEETEPAPAATPSPKPAPIEKKKEKKMAREGAAAGTIKTLLGPGASFEGKLSFEGTVRLEGSFKGEVLTDDELVIGEGAKVEAEVKVGTVVVHGEVKGNITAQKSVELHHPAQVFGNITTPSLLIEKGVVFEGNSRMHNLDKQKSTNGSTTSASAPSSTPSGGNPNAPSKP